MVLVHGQHILFWLILCNVNSMKLHLRLFYILDLKSLTISFLIFWSCISKCHFKAGTVVAWETLRQASSILRITWTSIGLCDACFSKLVCVQIFVNFMLGLGKPQCRRPQFWRLQPALTSSSIAACCWCPALLNPFPLKVTPLWQLMLFAHWSKCPIKQIPGEAQNEHMHVRIWIHVNKVFRVSEFPPMGPTSNEADRGDTQS